jgi:hypothetical protein
MEEHYEDDNDNENEDDNNVMVSVMIPPPPQEHFRGLLDLSKEMVLRVLRSGDGDNDNDNVNDNDAVYDHGAFSELMEDLLDVTRRTERLVKTGLVLPTEVREAQMILALAQLLPGATLPSLFTSLRQCLDVQTTSTTTTTTTTVVGSFMELVLDPDYNLARLFTFDSSNNNNNNNNNEDQAAAVLFQLETHLIAAQPSNNNNSSSARNNARPTKRRRTNTNTNTEYRASYWKVSLSYVLCQLAYDSLTLLPYPFTVEELLDRTQNLARPFGLHVSDLLVAAHALFLLDLFVLAGGDDARMSASAPSVHKKRMPEGLTLEHVVQGLTARRYVDWEYMSDSHSIAMLCYAMLL